MTKIRQYYTEAPYYPSPLDIYNGLDNHENTILLESAEIKTKFATTSLLVPNICVRIVAGINTVTLIAINDNGRNCLNHLQQVLSNFNPNYDGTTLTCSFAPIPANLEETARLKHPNVLNVLRTIKDEFQQAGSALLLTGVFAFDLLEISENIGQVPTGDNDCANYVFYIAETVMKFDHNNKTLNITGIVFEGDNAEELAQEVYQTMHSLKDITPAPLSQQPLDIKVQTITPKTMEDSLFCEQVNICKDYIKQGDTFQIVPSRTFSLPCDRPLDAYGTLKQMNPSPYMFYMCDSDFITFGASPESALKYESETNTVTLYPIAGTRPRGKNSDGSINLDLDSRLELDLRTDKKETSEHIMLLDLARNDIARISQPATRIVSALMQVDKYSHVQHLVSIVEGQLKSSYDCLHAYQSCMNMGTLTGAPKIRATEIIRELEQKRRGTYGGAVGYINGKGDMDTCITIRSAYVKNGVAHISAGCGVVLESDPQAEADETRIKAMPVMNAIAKVHNFKILQG